LEYKTSEAQRAAAKRYKEKNRDKIRIQDYKSKGLNFIRNNADLDDLEEFKEAIKEKENILKKFKKF
jgi:hypothetical protein